jgi:hypothetical protein
MIWKYERTKMAYQTDPDQDKTNPDIVNQRFKQTDTDPERLEMTDEEFDRHSAKIDEVLALRDPLTGVNLLDDALELNRERPTDPTSPLYPDEYTRQRTSDVRTTAEMARQEASVEDLYSSINDFEPEGDEGEDAEVTRPVLNDEN